MRIFKVHITQGDDVGKGVIVSWVTMDEPGSNTVLYWSGNTKQIQKAQARITTYKFYNYTSGYIHHCTINNLKVFLVNFWFHTILLLVTQLINLMFEYLVLNIYATQETFY